LDWVDLHYTINGGQPWQTNIRMVPNSANSQQFQYNFGIPLKTTDTLSMSFTYCSDFIDCDTPSESYTPATNAPTQSAAAMAGADLLPTVNGGQSSVSGTCPTIQSMADVPFLGIDNNGDDIYGLTFTAQLGASPDWVDAHYTLNNGQQLNYRMNPTSQGVYEIGNIALQSGDQMAYSFTSSVAGISCDTSSEVFVNNPQTADALASTAPGAQTQSGTSSTVDPTCGLTQYISQVVPAKPGPGGAGKQGRTLRFKLLDGQPTQWVDAHYTIATDPTALQPWQYNERMTANGDGSQFSIPGIPLDRDDILAYSFTFGTGSTSCDTGVDTYSL